MYDIRESCVDEIQSAPNINGLLLSYGDEGSIPEIGDPAPQWDVYRAMESAGLMKVLAAYYYDDDYYDDELVGFISLVISPLPHYGKIVATSESLFLTPDHRKGGPGILLIRAACDMAKAAGATAILISAPTGSRLDEVAPAIGFRETNRGFCRSLQ